MIAIVSLMTNFIGTCHWSLVEMMSKIDVKLLLTSDLSHNLMKAFLAFARVHFTYYIDTSFHIGK